MTLKRRRRSCGALFHGTAKLSIWQRAEWLRKFRYSEFCQTATESAHIHDESRQAIRAHSYRRIFQSERIRLTTSSLVPSETPHSDSRHKTTSK